MVIFRRQVYGGGAHDTLAPVIFLIRHGETADNAARIVQLPDAPLSSRGIAQAERLARRLAREGVAQILSSDLARARTTAECLQRVTGAPLTFEPLLHERNFGDIRGTPYAELRVDIFAPDYLPSNGESWPMFHARVDRAWERVQALASSGDGNLAVVTHGLVCRSLAGRHLCLPEGSAVPERWENTSVTIVECPAPWRVALLNCIAHLNDLDADALAETGSV
jgi:probable phosphoglycerate mutase